MATAVQFGETEIPGLVLEGLEIPPFGLTAREFKYWGVSGASEIYGGHGSRPIVVPILLFDDAEETEWTDVEDLAAYIHDDLNTQLIETNHDLTITSESGHPVFADCVFKGFALHPGDGVKMDLGGALGGGPFAVGLLLFKQLSTTLVDEEP